jgi:hypothetical protein
MQPVYKPVALFLLAIAVIVAVLLAIGTLELRIPPKSKGAAQEGQQIPGPRVELIEADKYFKMMGWESSVFKYSGGFLECWLEIETDGKTESVGKSLGRDLKATASLSEQPLAAESVRGHIIWLRRNDLTVGETWDLCITAGEEGREDSANSWVRNIVPSNLKPILEHDPGPGVHWGRSSAPSSGGTLRPSEEMVLATLTVSEIPKQGDSKTRRMVRLKCKLLAAGEGGKK